jgi:hypothetical protein
MQRRVDVTDRQIDQLVYESSGLTPEGIKMGEDPTTDH